LVEKEKKGHSYSSNRHPSLSEEKKTRIKAFTKEYTHKVLRKLKDKGKLRRPSSSTNGHSHRDHSSHAHARDGTTSTSSPVTATPGATPLSLSLSTPTAFTQTPTPSRHSSALAGELDDIFGVDPPDDDMDMDMDMDMEEDAEDASPEDIATPDQDLAIRSEHPEGLPHLSETANGKLRLNPVVKEVSGLDTPGTPSSGGPSPMDRR
jgi:histone-lysine N-methyltransferase SETD2